MGLHSLFGLDRYSVLTGLTENVNLTGLGFWCLMSPEDPNKTTDLQQVTDNLDDCTV
jgi:hypothetical protein